MMLDQELLNEFKACLADRFTAEELCELLHLDVWDIIEAFQEQIMELKLDE